MTWRVICKCPVEQWFCPYGASQMEYIIHYILHSPIYNKIRHQIIHGSECFLSDLHLFKEMAQWELTLVWHKQDFLFHGNL